MSAEDEALLLAKFVGNVGGCIPAAALPILVKALQDKYDLREQLRISQENVKFLQMAVFEEEGNLVQATAETNDPKCVHHTQEQA